MHRRSALPELRVPVRQLRIGTYEMPLLTLFLMLLYSKFRWEEHSRSDIVKIIMTEPDYSSESSDDGGIRYDIGRIYKITAITGKYYFGSTSLSLEERLYAHTQSTKGNHKCAKAALYFEKIGWDKVRIELISEHENITRRELLQFEDIQISEHIKDPLCSNQIRAVQDLEERRLKINAAAKDYRKEQAKKRADGDVEALASAAKATKRKGIKKLCFICNTSGNTSHYDKHRATNTCLGRFRKLIEETEKTLDSHPEKVDELAEWKIDLIRYEALNRQIKAREVAREDFCARCEITFPHRERGRHIAMHEAEDRQKAAAARIQHT